MIAFAAESIGSETRRRVAAVARRRRLDLVVLFGSQRTHRTTPRSDIDVAVLWGPRDRRPSLLAEGQLVGELSDALGVADNLDLAVLNGASALLLWEVARHGLPLYEARPGAFTEFWLYSLRMWRENAHRYEARARYLGEKAVEWRASAGSAGR